MRLFGLWHARSIGPQPRAFSFFGGPLCRRAMCLVVARVNLPGRRRHTLAGSVSSSFVLAIAHRHSTVRHGEKHVQTRAWNSYQLTGTLRRTACTTRDRTGSRAAACACPLCTSGSSLKTPSSGRRLTAGSGQWDTHTLAFSRFFALSLSLP